MMSRSGVLRISLLLLCTMAVRGWAQTKAAPPALEDFYPIGDYMLEIGGTPVPAAEFFLAERIPAVLITVPEHASAVVLFPSTSSVQTVPNANLVRESEADIDVKAGGMTEQGKLQILAEWIAFSIDGSEWVIKPKPWLLGVVDTSTMLGSSPEYRWRSKAYTPKPEVVQELSALSVNVKVRTYFGSWCSFCKHYVPLLLKVATQLNGSHIDIDFYGLPRGWGRHPVASPLQITAVPTGIVYVGDKEVGRITGNQWQSPEVSLKEILKQAGVS